MGLLTTLIGERGGGKTTYASWLANYTHQYYPSVPVITNTPIRYDDGTRAIYQEDVLKFLALKIIKEKDIPLYKKTFMEIIIDEAAQAGLESRGSGLKATDSRLITLSRKAFVDITLISQMMSMIEKRAQWNSDFYELCEAHYVTIESMERRYPDYFSYEDYNQDLKYQKTFYLSGDDAKAFLFDKFDTEHVPFMSQLESEFKQYYWQGDMDKFEIDSREFDRLLGINKPGVELSKLETKVMPPPTWLKGDIVESGPDYEVIVYSVIGSPEKGWSYRFIAQKPIKRVDSGKTLKDIHNQTGKPT